MAGDDQQNQSADASEMFFEELFNAAPAPLLVMDADTYCIVAANNAYLEAVAAQREDLVGKYIFDAFPDPDPAVDEGARNIAAALDRVKLTGKTDVMPVQHYPVPKRNGGFEDRYWSPVHAPVFDGSGRVRYIIQRPENVTDFVALRNRAASTDEDRRVLAERTEQMEADILQRSAELKRLNEHLRIAQRVAAIGSWEFRPGSHDAVYSDEMYRIFGYTHERPPENSGFALDAVCEDDKEKVAELRDALLEGHETEPLTFRIRKTDGQLRYVQARAEFERGGMGAVKTIYGTLQDITDQKEVEEALRVSEERFRLVAKATADTVFDWDVRTGAVWWNEGLRTIFGYDPAEFEDVSAFQERLIHQADRPSAERSLNQAMESDADEWRHEYRFVRRNGEEAQVVVRAFLIRDGNDQVSRVVGSVNDVTLRRLYEKKLQEQAALLDKARDAIIVHGLDHRIRYWSQGAERIYQWSREEAEDRSMVSLLCKEPAAFIAAVAETVENGEWNGRLVHYRKDGSSLMIDGAWSLMTDEQGEPDAILAINTDVTDRTRLEEQLRQSQRLEAVGQLTGGVAHDFNNLLTIILGNAELLMEPGTDSGEMREMVELIRDTAQRGSDLTQRLLAFARQQILKPRIVNVNELIRGMETLLRRTLLEHTQVEIVCQQDVWDTHVDPSRLEAAILNLAINARDAMGSGGNLIIETANVLVDEIHDATAHAIDPGRYVVISVSDTGKGIKPEHLDKVFDPFFTTKEKGKGTGLGLSMTYGFVKQSEGHVTIYSEVDKGTTVKLYLPRAEQEEELAQSPERSADEPRGTGRILVVEDDDQVRRLVVKNLERLGYDVLTASDGPAALDIIRDGEAIDLLFTDVIMAGGMNGMELAMLARELRPGLPVLFTSGYTEKVIEHHDHDGHKIELLEKPYRRSDLAQMVRKVMQKRGHNDEGAR